MGARLGVYGNNTQMQKKRQSQQRRQILEMRGTRSQALFSYLIYYIILQIEIEQISSSSQRSDVVLNTKLFVLR